MKVIDIPNINFNTNGDIDTAVDKIKDFYKALGWDEIQTVDPTKVKISDHDWKRLLSDLQSNTESKEERRQLGFMFVNYGPSVDEDLKAGKVRIYKGFLSN